jgi:hypothetical protein
MKTKRTLLLIALFAACSVMAQQQQQQTEQHTMTSSAAATMSVGNLNIHWLAPAKPVDWRNNRQPVEGLSPQSWTTVAGWHPGQSAFPDEKNFSTEMPLLWFGHEPAQ